jgi:hypothetical protein
MSDQITPAPQAHPIATPTPTPQIAVHPPQSNFSRPTTASAAQNPTATAPATTTTPTPNPTAAPLTTTTIPPAATTEGEHLSLNNKLNNADRYWKFKSVIQAIAIIVSLIGIGTIGWIVSTTPMNDTLTYGYDQYWTLWPSLITFAVSIVWCAACIFVLVLRKKPVHPGLRVSMDLLLWLAFIVTALFALVALMEIDQWGQYGKLDGYDLGGYSSSYGEYELQSNGTWVWENSRNSGSTTYGDDRACNRSTSSSSYYAGIFKNCAEQDAYVNKLWQEKPHREAVEMTGVVCQFFGLVLHLVLFVWACVDCHRYRRSKVSKDAEKLAADIVQTMITNGAVIPPPGQAHMRPGAPWGQQQQMGYYQLPQNGQGYPMQAMYPQVMSQGQHMPQQSQQSYHQQQGMMPPTMTGAAGPSNEKSEGPRYA